ncbi:hypothetical protein ACFL6S_35725 [Candidatus Poribacteria bacterium]
MADANSGSDIPIEPMSLEAQKFYKESFLPQYEALIKDVERTPLVIMIWGPGPTGGDLYKKRLQILNSLRDSGHVALLSEEVDRDLPVEHIPANARELLQAMKANFIVVIQGSPGSIAEVHDFGGLLRELGPKMLIFIDERSQEGYSFAGLLTELTTLYGNVETYEYPKDINECFLLQKVRAKIQVLQFAEWRKKVVR